MEYNFKNDREPSTTNTIPIGESITNYEYIEETASIISKIISKYMIDDVIKAVFCLNGWIKNRSALTIALTLNQSIYITEEFGSQRITNYKQFLDFFELINSHLVISPNDDLTLNDFGQVSIVVDGKVFPVILGTGYEQVFAALNFLPNLAGILGRAEELQMILEYNNTIISRLKEFNTMEADDNRICFELPTETFWNAVDVLFDSSDYNEHFDTIIKFMYFEKCPIEMRHIIKYKEEYYPLFNSSLLIDYYKELLSSSSTDENIDHIELTILKFLEGTYNFAPTPSNSVLVQPKLFNKQKKCLIDDSKYLFLASHKKGIVICVNKIHYGDQAILENQIKLIEDLHLKDELFFIESYPRDNIKGNRGIKISSQQKLEFILIDSFTDITSETIFIGSSSFPCTALDILNILYFINDFGELIDFIKYIKYEQAQIMSFGGISSVFFTWKQSNRFISQGAVDYNLISILYGTVDQYIYDYFTSNLKNYPLHIKSKMFHNPFAWIISDSGAPFFHLEHKGLSGFAGEATLINNSTFIFLAQNIEFFVAEDFELSTFTGFNVINELCLLFFKSFGEYFLSKIPFLDNMILQILYMPMHYAQKIDRIGFTSDETKEYLFSDIYVNESTIILRFTVKIDDLLNAISSSVDRRVEIKFFSELISTLEKYFASQDAYNEFIDTLRSYENEKKEVGVFTIEQDYYYSNQSSILNIQPYNYIKARKEIAKICFEKGIIPGLYQAQEATKIIRKMQEAIVDVFEKQIAEFDEHELHAKALSYCSSQIHYTNLNRKRYDSFSNLKEAAEKEFKEKTRNMREEYRRNVLAAQYLIESNLYVSHSQNRKCENDDLTDLMAFADWLVILQFSADTCHFTEYDLSIEIDDEFRVNTITSEEKQIEYNHMLFRKYEQTDYFIKGNETDKYYLTRCFSAFHTDTGVDFNIFLLLIEYLQLEVINDSFDCEILPNVFEIDRNQLLEDCLKYSNGMAKKDDLKMALDFITLHTQKLKNLGQTEHRVLTIWDREKRSQRFEVRPVVMRENICIFSPVVLRKLATLWKSGIMEWFTPYELGLDTLQQEIKSWKKYYENEMVQDIVDLFKLNEFDIVEREIDLASRFPNDDFPERLGDFDVLAISKTLHQIWLIESKVLQKVGSIFEDQMQQRGFFYQNKYDEKFQKRIDYSKENIDKIKTLFKLSESDYKIVPYMVINKVFVSRYKDLDFPIVSFGELKEILKKSGKS